MEIFQRYEGSDRSRIFFLSVGDEDLVLAQRGCTVFLSSLCRQLNVFTQVLRTEYQLPNSRFLFDWNGIPPWCFSSVNSDTLCTGVFL